MCVVKSEICQGLSEYTFLDSEVIVLGITPADILVSFVLSVNRCISSCIALR